MPRLPLSRKSLLLATTSLPALTGLAIPLLRDADDFDGRDPLTGRRFSIIPTSAQ